MKGIGGSGFRESHLKVKMPATTYSGSVVATIEEEGGGPGGRALETVSK